MKVKSWLKVTSCCGCTIRINDEVYDFRIDGDKEIRHVIVQSNGIILIYTK